MPAAIPYIAIALSIGSAIYAASLDLSTEADDTGSLINKAGTRATRDVVYGRCLTGATPLWTNVYNNNSSKLIQVFSCGIATTYIHQILIDEVEVLSVEGTYRETTDIDSLWFNPQTPIGYDSSNTPIYAPNAGNLKNGFHEQCELQIRTGWPTSAPTHDGLPIGTPMNLPILLGDGEWTSKMRGDYTTMLAISSRRIVDSESTRIMSDQIQVNMLVSGVPVFDPRTGSDPNVKSFSRNPALAALDYITNSYYGMGINISKLDVDSFATAANYCDSNNLYIDGQLNQGESFATNLDNICKCAQLHLFIENGVLVCKYEDVALPSFAFNEDNIINGTMKVTEQTSGSYANVISVDYKNSELEDKEDVYTIPANIYPTVTLPNGSPNPDYPTQPQVDGYVATSELNMPMTRYAGSDANNNSPMQKFANRELIRQQFQKEVEFDVDKEEFNVAVFDVIQVSDDGIGWADKPFRITGYKTKVSDEDMNIVTIIAKEYDDSIYLGTANGTPPSQRPTPTPVVTPPTALSIDTTQPAHAVFTWTPTWFEQNTTYEIAIRKVTESDFTRIGTTGSERWDFEILDPDSYDFAVRTISPTKGTSVWAQLVAANPTVDAPTNIRVDFTQSAYAVVYWDTTETDKSTYHEVSYKLDGSSDWINPVSTYETQYTIETQLKPASYRVRTVNKQYGYSSWTVYVPTQPSVTPPTSLAFVQHNTGSNAGGTLSWVGTWNESNVKYQVEFKPSSSATWTQLNTVEAESYDFPTLPPNTYDFRVATKSTLYGLSQFTTLTNQVVQPIGVVGPVTGVSGTTTTRDHTFSWDSALEESITLPPNPSPISPDDPKVKDYFSHYQVDIFNSAGTLKGQYQAVENSYVFTYEQNKATVGGADRTIRIDVYVVLKDGTKSQIGPSSTATVKNEQIVSTTDSAIVTPSLESFTLEWSQREELDYMATLVHVSTTQGFTPNTANRKADSNSNTFYYLVPEADRGKTHYVRFSHHDTFGHTDLTYTAEQSVVPQNIDELLPNFPDELTELRDPDKAVNNTGELSISVSSPNKKHVSGVGLYAKDTGATRLIVAADEFVVSTGGHANWNGTTAYITGDKVSWNISDTEQRLYIALRNNTNAPPLSSPSDWRLAVANTYQSAFYVNAADERLLIRNATIDNLTANNIRANALTGDTLDFNTVRGDQITSETTIIAGINRKQADVWQMNVGSGSGYIGYNFNAAFGSINNTIFRGATINSLQSNPTLNVTYLSLDQQPNPSSPIYMQANNGHIYQLTYNSSNVRFENTSVSLFDSSMVGDDITIWISDNDNSTTAIAALNGSDLGDTTKPNNVGVRIFAGAQTGVVDVTKPVGNSDRYAPFMVDSTGKMYARDAVIKGHADIESGTIKGNLELGDPTTLTTKTMIRGNALSDTHAAFISGYTQYNSGAFDNWKYKINHNGSVQARNGANEVIMDLDPSTGTYLFKGDVFADSVVGDVISQVPRMLPTRARTNLNGRNASFIDTLATFTVKSHVPYDRLISMASAIQYRFETGPTTTLFGNWFIEMINTTDSITHQLGTGYFNISGGTADSSILISRAVFAATLPELTGAGLPAYYDPRPTNYTIRFRWVSGNSGDPNGWVSLITEENTAVELFRDTGELT